MMKLSENHVLGQEPVEECTLQIPWLQLLKHLVCLYHFLLQIPANNKTRNKVSIETGKSMKNLIEADIKPLDIITKKSIENAVTTVVALGGSTNAVLHFLAICKSCKS